MAKIGFIGTGNMGGALITAACKGIDPKEVVIADYIPEKAQALAAELGCRAASNSEVAKEAEFVVLAVKPNVIRDVAKGIELRSGSAWIRDKRRSLSRSLPA